MRNLSEIHTLGEELTQQAIGILVGAVFPAMVWMEKITPHGRKRHLSYYLGGFIGHFDRHGVS